ncbi:hypothetical protein N7488_000900 [Penicillium malachiteum]|nr:hypothetical protein N7488_000900 [Penicillium malachiteum]
MDRNMTQQLAPFTTNLLGISSTENAGHVLTSLFPSTYRTADGELALVKSNKQEFLASDLSVDRLDDVFQHLWMVGLPIPPRPLHYQLVLQRKIVICEKMDMHLVWGNDQLFLKPIPLYLLSPTIWETLLKCPQRCKCSQGEKCATKVQRNIALGFLFTYTALLSFESDFVIAKAKGLLPQDLSLSQWTEWQKFAEELITPSIYEDIHRRFRYGELRLGRLNLIYLFTKFGYYMNQWSNYNSFLQDQLGWLAATTIYIAVVLTAMQLGLSTDQLKANSPYMSAAYGFSVFAILGPLVACGGIFIVLMILVVTNWNFQKAKSAKRFKQMTEYKTV